MVSPSGFKGMKWQGRALSRCAGCTYALRKQSVQGCTFSVSPALRQVIESRKYSVGLQGVRTERPYPPSSKTLLFSLNLSMMSSLLNSMSPPSLSADNMKKQEACLLSHEAAWV